MANVVAIGKVTQRWIIITTADGINHMYPRS